MGERLYPVTQQGKQGRQKFAGWNLSKYRVLLGLAKCELPVDNQEEVLRSQWDPRLEFEAAFRHGSVLFRSFRNFGSYGNFQCFRNT